MLAADVNLDSQTTTPAHSTRVGFLSPVWDGSSVKVEEFDMCANGSPAPFCGSRFEIAPGGRSSPDVHEVCECWLIAAGTGNLYYDGKAVGRVGVGDVLRFESRHEHWVENEGENPLLIFSIWWSRVHEQ
jgi:quercetin dioxygenase-like cupin family protein